MTSLHNVFKSLKDTLLEYAVLNMDLLFTDQCLDLDPIIPIYLFEEILVKVQNNKSPSYEDDKTEFPIFPNYLFEEILEKSKDMCWPISKNHLLPCIAARKRLKWSETECFGLIDDFFAKDLEIFDGCRHALKTLNVSVYLKGPKCLNIFKVISETADSLEDLHLNITMSDSFRCKYTTASGTVYTDKIMTSLQACAPLKLKRLILNLHSLDWFPYTFETSRLMVFELYGCLLTKSLLKTLVSFKHLAHLFLTIPELFDVSLGDVIEAVACLSGLQILSISILDEKVNEQMLNKITNHLLNLDILELWIIECNEPNRLLIPRRKLKVLNYGRLVTTFDISAKLALTGLAHKIGHFENLNGIMIVVSTTPSWIIYSVAVISLFEKIEFENADHNMLIEAEKSGWFNFRSSLRLTESILYEHCSYGILQRITCYGVKNHSTRSFPFLKKWIKEFIENNDNTHLTNRFRRLLESGQ